MDAPIVSALEKRLLSGLKHANDLLPLLECLANPENTPLLRIKAAHATRRVFTAWWHAGHLHSNSASASASAAETAGRKRPRDRRDAAAVSTAAGDAASAVAKWLRTQFFAFLETLYAVLATPEPASAASNAPLPPGKDHTALQISATRTIAHFFAHATSLPQQQAERGQHFGYEVLVWLLQHALSVDATDSNASRGERHAARSVLSALTVLRSEFVDEYDDVRFFVFKAIAALAGAKADGPPAAAKGAGAAAGAAAAADSRSQQAFRSAQAGVVQRNAVELLLSIALPLTASEWSTGTRGSWVRKQWGSDPAMGPVYAALDAGIAAGAAAKAAREAAAKAATASYSRRGGRGAAAKAPGPLDEEEEDDGDGGVLARGRGMGELDRSAGAAEGDSDEDEEDGEGSEGGPGSEDPEEGGEEEEEEPVTRAGGGASSPAVQVSSAPKYLLFYEQRRAFAEAWIAVLRIPSPPEDVRRRCLVSLPSAVLPHMPGRYPLLLADYLTSCLAEATAPAPLSGASASSSSSGEASPGAVADALLALQSLFMLMTQHGLEYPRFYTTVYALLSPLSIAAKHRARLFKLLDLFLSSSALPAYLVAAFVKRAARLALTAPAPFALFALPFIYNCVKRHPAVTPLLQRVVVAGGASGSSGGAWPAPADPFDAATNDPAASRALSSSLWELAALTHHYHGPVATLARSIASREAFTKAEYDVSDPATSGATYGGLFSGELGRTVTKGGEKEPAEVPFEFRRAAGGLAGLLLQ